MLSVHEVLQRRYRIVRLIGKGSIGAVYEAVDESFGEPVAIKEVRYELTDSIDQRQLELLRNAFKREAKSLAKARHPAVPYVRDYFLDRERQYLVMDMVEGDDLGSLLRARGRPFEVDDVLNWAEQLLGALDHLQNLVPSVIHGDIKPKNLKVAPGGQLKLLDLGIAKTVDDTAFTVRPSDLEFTALNYLSFEQVLHVIDPTFRDFILEKHRNQAVRVLKQSCDARSDIYMVGATIYYLLTNRPATDVVTRTIATWDGRPDPLPDPSEINPEIPGPVSNCILKALAVDRDDRYGSASAMLVALTKAARPSTQPNLLEIVNAAANGNGRSVRKSRETTGLRTYSPIQNEADATPPSSLSTSSGPTQDVTTPLPVPAAGLLTFQVPTPAAEAGFKTQKVELLYESGSTQENENSEARDDVAETVQNVAAHEIEVEPISTPPIFREFDTAFPGSQPRSSDQAEIETPPIGPPDTVPQTTHPDSPDESVISEAFTLNDDKEPEDGDVSIGIPRATSNGNGKLNTAELWSELTDSTVPPRGASRWVPAIPRVPLWLSLTAVAVALTVFGIAVLLWLLSLGRPTGDISVANAAPRRPADSRVAGPPAAESSKVQQPAPQVQTAQPAFAQEQSTTAVSPAQNPVPSEENPKKTEPQVRPQKQATERQRSSKPQAVVEPSPAQPKQEKKKITVDDLINDN